MQGSGAGPSRQRAAELPMAAALLFQSLCPCLAKQLWLSEAAASASAAPACKAPSWPKLLQQQQWLLLQQKEPRLRGRFQPCRSSAGKREAEPPAMGART